MLTNISSGIVIYKGYASTYNDPLNFERGRERCEEDSAAAGVSGFLHLPMPQSEDENEIYRNIINNQKSYDYQALNHNFMYLDITEVQPQTLPRTWELKNGTSATWFNWNPNLLHVTNPNYELPKAELLEYGVRPYIQMDPATGLWTDVKEEMIDYTGEVVKTPGTIVCSYFLPAYSLTYCPWLSEFED